MITEKFAIVSLTGPEILGYGNVYDQPKEGEAIGDIWEKIQGCEACTTENRKKCCGRCAMLMEDGKCRLHVEDNGQGKPYHCIPKPHPDTKMSLCALAFKCVRGSNKGRIKRVNSNEFE